MNAPTTPPAHEKPVMNEDNKKAAHVLFTQGPDAALDYMFSGGVPGQKLTYSEMRARYG